MKLTLCVHRFIEYCIKIVLEAEFPPGAHFFTIMSHCFCKDLFLLQRQSAYLLNLTGQGTGWSIHSLARHRAEERGMLGTKTTGNRQPPIHNLRVSRKEFGVIRI